MQSALDEAARGLAAGLMPIGAVLVCEGDVLARAHWRGIVDGLLAHPEHEVLVECDPRVAQVQRRSCTLYTTLEPCLMCMGTAMSFGVGRIVFAMRAPADGAADVASRWMPRHGHPPNGVPYTVPAVEGGCDEASARALVLEWLDSGVGGAEAEFARRTLQT